MAHETIQLTKPGTAHTGNGIGNGVAHYRNGYVHEDEYPFDDEPPQSEAGSYVSEALYWEKYYEHLDFNYEWNNGILEEKPMADVQNAAMYRWLLKLLEAYLETHAVAQLVNLEIGFRLLFGKKKKKTSIRKPDLFVVRYDNPVPLLPLDRNYRGICDLCIESLSDSTQKEIDRDVKTKKGEYEGVGVHEYYILDAGKTNMKFYRRTPGGVYAPLAPIDGEIIQSAVLPGFQFRISDLHCQPPLIALANDEVYKHFVLPEYQAAIARAERLAAKLRALGINEDELESEL